MYRQVATQVEFDAALADRAPQIELTAQIEVRLHVPSGYVPWVKAAPGVWVILLESGRVEARESSCVVARGSSSVVARESSRVEAWGSSRVVAWGSSRVVARAAVALAVRGASVKAKATSQVGVHLHDGGQCDGGQQIIVKQPRTACEWCDWYGAEIHGGHALLFKALNDGFLSPHGATYQPGTETVAKDWDGGIVECGEGLHFSPSPAMARSFNESAIKFVGCLVPLDSIAIHPDGSSPEKAKAEKCWTWFECDLHGDVIGERHPLPAAKPVKQQPKTKRGSKK